MADFISARRVLIYRLGSLGDTVVALPSLHLIARAFPQARRVMLTNFPVHAKAPASASVIGDSGLIHGYMRYGARTRNPLELSAVWWQIRRFNPDVLVYLMPVRSVSAVRRDAIFFRLAGLRSIIGLPSEEELQHRFDEKTERFESEANRLARSIRVLGDARVEDLRNWDLGLGESEHRTADLALSALSTRPFLVCGPGTKMQSKDWGVENWAALMQRLSPQFPDHGLVLVGAKEERAICEKVARGWGDHALNLCGDLQPRETAAVLARATLFLGPDSGPMHLAHAVGTPCAIAFSARGKPGVWFPRGKHDQVVYRPVNCRGCNLVTCVDERKKCLTSITVDDMFHAALSASQVTDHAVRA